jgi:hypothetical protein
MKKTTILFLGLMLISNSCSKKVLQTDSEIRKLRTGDIMEMNSEEFLVSNNTWELITTKNFKFFFDKAISKELQQETIKAQKTNFNEILRFMGIQNKGLTHINFYLFKDKEQKKQLTQVDSDAHAISTFPAVYYLPINSKGAQEVGHVMTQKYWGFIPKTSNYSLIIDEGFNYYIDDERFYNGTLCDKAINAYNENNNLTINELVVMNNGTKITGVESGSHEQNVSDISGCFVKHLIKKYGIKKFEQLWKLASNDETARPELFEEVYNIQLAIISKEFANELNTSR